MKKEFVQLVKITKENYKNKEHDWIEEALEHYSKEDILGSYDIVEKNEAMVTKKFNPELEIIISVDLGQYLSGRFFREGVEAIVDEKGNIWIDLDLLA